MDSEARPWPRLTTAYALHRTSSGRWSSGTDNTEVEKSRRRGKISQVQNIPKAPRDMFVADPGWRMVGGDWAAIQWALAMWRAAQINKPAGYHIDLLTKHQTLGADGKPLLDPHLFLAQTWAGPEAGAEERQQSKPFTFGYLFYGTPQGISWQTGIPVKKCEKVFEAWLEAFKLNWWWEHELELALRRKFVETAAGFRRYFLEPVARAKDGSLRTPKPTEILAHAIQGDEADLNKYVHVKIAEELGPEMRAPDLEWLTAVHDSSVWQAREADAAARAQWLLSRMQMPVPFLGGRSWRAEVKVGESWKGVS